MVARVTETLRPRPGGRATRVVSSVLQATVEELARLGYQALRVEDVAIRASVNKTTIYRRWPTKTDLVLAALHEASNDLDFIPDTGSVRGDMLALLEHTSHMNDSTAVRAFISLILAEFVAPEIARLVGVMRFEYRERWIGIVRRGIARGELPATTSAHLLAELFASVPTMRKLRNDEPLDADNARGDRRPPARRRTIDHTVQRADGVGSPGRAGRDLQGEPGVCSRRRAERRRTHTSAAG